MEILKSKKWLLKWAKKLLMGKITLKYSYKFCCIIYIYNNTIITPYYKCNKHQLKL